MPVPAFALSDGSVTDATGTILGPPQKSVSVGMTPLGTRKLYLAVDCGGSKAAAAIAISGDPPSSPPTFLARGFGGAANYTDVGLHKFLRSVKQAVENALDDAEVQWRHLPINDGDSVASAPPYVTISTSTHTPSARSPRWSKPDITPFPPIFFAAWLGIAGVDSPLNIAVLSPHLSNLFAIPYPSSRLIVANDTSLLASPVMEPDEETPEQVREGVVCIAGTGSIVMSFRSRDQHSPAAEMATGPTQGASESEPSGASTLLEAVGRVGGFGWLLGDEAGGFMVGRKAVRAVLDQADRERLGIDEEQSSESDESGAHASNSKGSQGRQHLLRDRILAHWNLASTDDLLDTVYSIDVVMPSASGASGGGQRASLPSFVSSSMQDSDDDRSTINGADGDAIAAHQKAGSSALNDPSQQLLPPDMRSSFAHSHIQATHRTIDPNVSPVPSIPSYPSSPRPDGSPHVVTSEASGSDSLDGSTKTLLITPTPRYSSVSSAGLDPLPRLHLPGALRQRRNDDEDAQIPPPGSVQSQAFLPAVATGARKLRLASLAPVVFHLAFSHGDELSLGILREEIRSIVSQIRLLLQREDMPKLKKTSRSGADSALTTPVPYSESADWSKRKGDPRRVVASRSILCLGGSLLGVEGYRKLLVDELESKGFAFKKVVHVEDVARRGCEALARGWESGVS